MCKIIPTSTTVKALRATLSQFATGVAVVTAITDQGRPIGMTISSFNSVSMTPALIAWCIDCRSANYQTFSDIKRFAITILSEDQIPLAERFATRGADKFKGIPIQGGEAPLIPGGCAWFQCETERSLLMGDHRMLIGRVVSFEKNDNAPLIFCQSKLQGLTKAEPQPDQMVA